jgi:hypothetical protein
MSESNATEMAKKITKKLMATKVKFFQDEMKKMQDEMSKMKEELSKKVEDAISGKKVEDATSSKNDTNKDAASDVGDGEPTQGKGIYSNMNFNYAQLIKGSPLHTPFVNLGKPPYFDGTRYNNWAYKMKMHLIAIRLGEVVDVGVMFPTDEDREITPEEVHTLHQNAQVIALLVSSLGPDEFNKVNGRESAKEIWKILRTSFESDKSVRKGNIKLLHGELERFVFLQGETTQAMFDRLMALVNHIRALEAPNGMTIRLLGRC